MRKIITHYHTLNKVGLWLSILCTIHCIAMPFLITAIPFLSGSFISERSEIYLIGVSAIIAVFLLVKDYRNHQNALPLILLAFAFSFNLIGLFLAKGIYEITFNVIGALTMATAYWINWKEHRRVFHSHDHAH
ncbi:MerC domain-containing protein [Emticicia sp. SJ17W-69]|uniref:MerC domain-containing protein n=1 Tax=Emticicia sp. SJ17W-69 TaxID=3421657 RepID=UPI003EBA6653